MRTLTGLVDLCRTLLSRSQQYLHFLIGHFTTDPLEKEFSKLRQGSGGTYFLSFQQVVDKLDISKTKQLLKLKEDVRNLEVDVGHRCSKCCFSLDEVTCEIFDSLPKLEENVAEETKMTIVHVAGYVTRNDDVTDDDLFEVDMKYYRKYGAFTQSIDRGGLNVPSVHSANDNASDKRQNCRLSLALSFENLGVRTGSVRPWVRQIGMTSYSLEYGIIFIGIWFEFFYLLI